MTVKEITRSEIFSDLQKKAITQLKAAEILGISVRQVRRIFQRYKALGPIGLISKKRGKPGNHRLPNGLKDLALAIIQEKYRDFGPTLAHEKLIEDHHLNKFFSLLVGKRKNCYHCLENGVFHHAKRMSSNG